MKSFIATTTILMSLTACGIKSEMSNSKSTNDPVKKSNYSCFAVSILDSTVTPNHINSSSQFDFNDNHDWAATRIFVTTGDTYEATASREKNSEGDRINLSIVNLTTKATFVSQVEEGAASPLLSVTPDGKFQISLVCRKK